MTMQRIWLHAPINWPRTHLGETCRESVARGTLLCINSAQKQDPVCLTVAAARCLVSHFKKSAKATAALAEKQRERYVAEHKLMQDVATRWNAVYLMLDRLIEQRGPVSDVLTDSSVSKRSD